MSCLNIPLTKPHTINKATGEIMNKISAQKNFTAKIQHQNLK